MLSYSDKLKEEAAIWDAVSIEEQTPLDWDVQKRLLHNAAVHTEHIEMLLAAIQPGMTVLELGCGAGWLSLAMAQRGADVIGIDISMKSLQRAQAWHDQHCANIPGSATFYAADINRLALRANVFDIIVTKGTLHHLMEMKHVILEAHRALKPGGLLWISDQNGDETLHTSLFAGGLMLMLPTHLSYREKFAGLLAKGVHAPASIKASMEAEGLSPFEGVGRDHDWVVLVQQYFQVQQIIEQPAVTGYLAHHIALPYPQALAVLRAIKLLDGLLVRLGVLTSTGRVVFARKPLVPGVVSAAEAGTKDHTISDIA